MTDIVKAEARAFAAWKKVLLPKEAEAVEEMLDHANSEILYAHEVFDAIVAYEGGMATGYEIRGIVRRVYGVDLI